MIIFFKHVLLKKLTLVLCISDENLLFIKCCKKSINSNVLFLTKTQFCHICLCEIYICSERDTTKADKMSSHFEFVSKSIKT
jgi:hypothetical protein